MFVRRFVEYILLILSQLVISVIVHFINTLIIIVLAVYPDNIIYSSKTQYKSLTMIKKLSLHIY